MKVDVKPTECGCGENPVVTELDAKVYRFRVQCVARGCKLSVPVYERTCSAAIHRWNLDQASMDAEVVVDTSVERCPKCKLALPHDGCVEPAALYPSTGFAAPSPPDDESEYFGIPAHMLCRQCRGGWAPPQVHTFNPACPGCRRKKREGRRTGDEPHPRDIRPDGRVRIAPAKFEKVVTKARGVRAAMRERYSQLPIPGAA